MSPGPISRRGLVIGGAAVLGTVALPAGAVEAATVDVPFTGGFAALPVVFDPAAFIRDLIDAGYRVSAARSIPENPLDEWIPSLRIEPPPGRGFRSDYAAIMRKWSDAIDACPDYIQRAVDYAFAPREPTLPECA